MTAQQPSRCIAAFLLVLAGLVLGGNPPAAAAQVPADGPATYIYDGTDDPSVQTHPLTAAASRTHSARLAPAVAFNAEHTSTAATGFAAEAEGGAASAAGKTFQTYTKVNPETGEVYVGRTSGTGSPLENLTRRDYGHAYNEEGFGPARLDQSSDSYAANRGREQQLIDYFRDLGVSANKINGISPLNEPPRD